MSQDTEPHVNLNQEHEDLTFRRSLVPDTMFRLRLSVLKDNQGDISYPSQMFTFRTFQNLDSAVGSIDSHFGRGFSTYVIQRSGILEVARGTEDGRTEDMTLEFDSVTANESWNEFLKRVQEIGKNWQVEQVGGQGKEYEGVA